MAKLVVRRGVSRYRDMGESTNLIRSKDVTAVPLAERRARGFAGRRLFGWG
jgi:hypothetical protein